MLSFWNQKETADNQYGKNSHTEIWKVQKNVAFNHCDFYPLEGCDMQKQRSNMKYSIKTVVP